MPVVSLEVWNQWVEAQPGVHLLQQGQWGGLKSAFGWKVERLISGKAGAQLLFRMLPLGLSLGYLPRGPVGEGWGDLLAEVDDVCRRHKAVFVKIEPDAWAGEFFRADALEKAGYRPSGHALQPRRTVVVDISRIEDDILAEMKQKTRYNIRLAGRKEVVTHPSDDLDAFVKLMEITGERDEFGVHTGEYYRKAYELFHPAGMCELFLAAYHGRPLAGVMVFTVGTRAWYLYGASNNQERNRMPAYLLQWEAIRWAKAKGCISYDLYGVPDHDDHILEEEFADRSEGLWGVYRFKRGFGGELLRAETAWDKVYRPLPYQVYRLLMRGKGAAG